MCDNLSYMFGKLSKAVEILITNPGDARKRVWAASDYIFMVQPEGLPESLRSNIKWIHAKMTRYPADEWYPSALYATYHRTRNSTAGKIATQVWDLYHLMSSEIEARQQKMPQREPPNVIVTINDEMTIFKIDTLTS